MKISLNWLRTLVQIEQTAEEIEALLTATGLEVENYEYVESVKGGMKGLLIGRVVECQKHPNADKLSLTKVDIGSGEILSIVCGAPNVRSDIKVIVAPVGTIVHPLNSEPFEIKKAKIRGENSEGMLCAEDEIGLGESHAGLMILPEDAQLGMKLSDYFKIESDVVFEIGLTANRGDAASHAGVARELATVLNLPFSLKESTLREKKADLNIQIEIEDKDACPRYSGILLNNIQVKESPEWLKNRLNSIGLKPINNVVDITNFVLHELGQPLHAFDYSKIRDQKIVVRRARNGENFKTLDAVERKLHGHELMICDSEKPMCLAGTYGGADSGVSESTESIFLESAFFAPDVIRKAAKSHALNTDSSFRFERGTDPEMCLRALKLASEMICEYAGAQVASDIYDIYPEILLPFKVSLRNKEIKRITGIEIPAEVTEQILSGLGITIINKNENGYELEVPRFKSDVNREIDVIEELIRIYGFNHIPLQTHLHMSLNYKPEGKLRETEQEISRILSANGFNEIMNNSLSSDKYYSDRSELVYISNPLSAELNIMRADMLYGALETIAYNKNRKQNNNRFFEFGKIYKSKEKGFSEKDQLLIIASGNKTNESWEEPSKEADHYYIKSITRILLNGLGIDEKAPEISEVPASLLKEFGIKDKVYYTCLQWSKYAGSKKAFKLQAVPQFPVVRRDLSLVLDKSVKYQQVEEIIRKKGGKNLISSNVFDVYTGKPLESHQKAISISLELYDDEKTMQDSDIDPVIQALINDFEKELNAVIRK